MSIIDYLNPLSWFPAGEYSSFWKMLFASLLQGFFAKIIAVAFLVLAFWLGVRRQQPYQGFIYFTFCLVSAFGGSLLKWIGLLK